MTERVEEIRRRREQQIFLSDDLDYLLTALAQAEREEQLEGRR